MADKFPAGYVQVERLQPELRVTLARCNWSIKVDEQLRTMNIASL